MTTGELSVIYPATGRRAAQSLGQQLGIIGELKASGTFKRFIGYLAPWIAFSSIRAKKINRIANG